MLYKQRTTNEYEEQRQTKGRKPPKQNFTPNLRDGGSPLQLMIVSRP